MFFFFYNDNVQIKLGASPKEADVAIVSINSGGTVGELNQIVLNEYGFDKSILKKLNLGKGFDLIQLNGKAILFVVTVGIGNPINNLNENLKQAIAFHIQTLTNKKIWIPLMATGAGKLSYNESLRITLSVLENLKELITKSDCQFIISLPDDKKGKILYDQIKESKLESLNIDSTINNNPKDVNNVIEQLNANYYFVGVDWEGNNQTERFYKQGIWETGYDDRLTGIIKNILVGDILIIKEPYAINNQSYNKIIAIGKVIENPMDGTSVNVDWIVKKLSFEIEAIGYNSSTITTAHLDSVKEIFSKIKSVELQKIKPSFTVRKRAKLENADTEIINKPYATTLPGLLSDVETGEDHLDIKKDVEAFARVIAAKSFEPPLAIALLGKWGSGKSFFMHKLKEDIQKLSKSNPQNAFCEGIAHVHFNAWSYMDANLWASIVTRIFEGLEDYIKSSGASDKKKKEIEEHLFQKLTISKDQLKELNGQKEKVDTHIKDLETKRGHIQVELNDKISSIRKSTLINILKKVDEDFKVKEKIEKTLIANPTFTDSAEKFEKIIPKEYWDNPEEFLKQLKSGYTFFKAFFSRDNIWINILWTLFFIAIVILVPLAVYFFNLQLSWQNFTLTKTQWIFISFNGAILTRGIDTFLKLKKQIAPFWKIKEDYETMKKNALFNFEQEEKALKLEIENSKEEIIILDKQITFNKELKANLEFKLKNALSTEALYTFIEKRANSEDYKKHLGIVSMIRKDFEILSGLLTGHKTELVTNAESEYFKNMFKNKKSLERIILYIDDLDRCPEERVVEVLEAVNLLMAFPLFVVVVGVDPRWVRTVLIKKHKNQFSENIENEDKISPSNYLEKIFQVPFHLKDADDSSIKNMIEKLAKTKHNLSVIIKNGEQENSAIPDSVNVDIAELNENDEQKITKTLNIPIVPKTDEIIIEEQIKALDITDKEIEQIKSITEIIGNNPRAIKRFVNIYRIVKTHEDFDYNEDIEKKELLTIMFLLALPMGKFKDLMESFESFLGKKTVDFETLNNYVNPPSSLGGKKHDDLLSRKTELKMILQNSGKKTLEINVTLFRKHNSFIKRFTFNNI